MNSWNGETKQRHAKIPHSKKVVIKPSEALRVILWKMKECKTANIYGIFNLGFLFVCDRRSVGTGEGEMFCFTLYLKNNIDKLCLSSLDY